MRYVVTVLDVASLLADRVAYLAHQYGADDASEVTRGIYVNDVTGCVNGYQSPVTTLTRESERRLPQPS